MANNSFFYGATPSPEANTVDQLIDSLEAKVQSATTAETNAAASATSAQQSASAAASNAAAVSSLATQATETLAAAQQAVADSVDNVELSRDWAQKLGGTVDGTGYSAKYWATQADVGIVAANIADINSVAAIDTEVTAVAGNATNINTVAGNNTNVTNVAANIANVNAVAGNATNINAVNANKTNIDTVATNNANVTAVGTNISNVNAVAGNATNINAVNANKTNIDTVAANNGNVTTVGGSIANVNAVAGNSTNINTVAGISGNVTTVAGISTNVTTVATNTTNVNTVASNIGSINTNAANITAIQNASTNATNAANSAAAAATSASNSANSAASALAIYGNTTVMNNAVASATASQNAAATSATNAANSATQAANSAASAAAIVTGVASNRPSIRPSLLLDFQYTKQLDPRITFSRPTTATYYDGKTVVKAEENLLTYSQDFNTSWGIGNATVTANTVTAPDGTTTADTWANVGANTVAEFYKGASQITVAGQNTLSCFMKAGTNSYVTLLFTGAYNQYATAVFDLSNGIVSQTAAPGDVKIVSTSCVNVGGGWFRCVLSVNLNAPSSYVQFFQVSAATGNVFNIYGAPYNVTIADAQTIYIWGAQLEQRNTVTAYTPTTTAPITNYIPALQTAVSNDARFDHDPVTGESKGLLIEEQRTNLHSYSDQFDNSAWTKYAASISANTVVAPDGTLTGDKLVEDTASASHGFQTTTSISISNSTAYTYSIYAKAGERNWIVLFPNSGGSNAGAWFNLSTGAVGTRQANNTTAVITSVGNGWYRCSITWTSTASGATMALYMATADNTLSYTGNGYSGIYIWGAQLEAGSFPTSYIPTVASQVTRSADSASMTGTNFSSWYRADEGTIYTDSVTYGGNGPITYITDNSSNNLHQVNANFGGSNQFTAYTTTNGTNIVNFNGTALTYGTSFKIGYGFKTNDFAASVNGAAVSTDTSGIPPSVNRLDIGRRFDGTYTTTSTIKRIAYYPKRLSNTELQGLTS